MFCCALHHGVGEVSGDRCENALTIYLHFSTAVLTLAILLP